VIVNIGDRCGDVDNATSTIAIAATTTTTCATTVRVSADVIQVKEVVTVVI
jgi:hypothetical protein